MSNLHCSKKSYRTLLSKAVVHFCFQENRTSVSIRKIPNKKEKSLSLHLPCVKMKFPRVKINRYLPKKRRKLVNRKINVRNEADNFWYNSTDKERAFGAFFFWCHSADTERAFGAFFLWCHSVPYPLTQWGHFASAKPYSGKELRRSGGSSSAR
jgi:hypothetical protein